jgi:hypothetical protein
MQCIKYGFTRLIWLAFGGFLCISLPIIPARAQSYGQSAIHHDCDYNASTMMSLSENEFDQTPGKGWRQVADKAGCEIVAANLIAKYRDTHRTTSELSYWHEGQLRAFAGDYNGSIRVMRLSYKKHDETGWNYYVDATISFLSHDKSSFDKYKERLAKIPVPDGLPPPMNGFIELKSANGSSMKMAWPINMDVLNGLDVCFNKSYKEAYGDTCRSSGSHPVAFPVK